MHHRSRTTTGISLAALVTSSVLVLSGCATAGSEEAGTGPVAPGETIKIGFIGPLSGPSASLGVTARNGMELAVAQLNESNALNAKVELVAVDDEADAAKSATAAQKMVTEDGVIAVIGGPNSGTVKANNPIITGAGVVNLISIAQSDALIDPTLPGYDLTYRVSENNSYDISSIVSLFEAEDYEAICAVADTTEYGQGGISSITSVFEGRGLTIHKVVQHEVNATDLTSQVLSLRDADCDSIYLYDYGQDAALFMKTVNQVGWDVPVIGGRALTQAAFLSIAGEAGDGIIFPSVIDPNKDSAADFITAYDDAYGADNDPAHVFASLGYDSVMLLAEGLKASGNEGGAALATALQSVSYEGVTGREGSTLGFSADNHEAPSDDYITFWTIKGGKYTLYSADVESGLK